METSIRLLPLSRRPNRSTLTTDNEENKSLAPLPLLSDRLLPVPAAEPSASPYERSRTILSNNAFYSATSSLSKSKTPSSNAKARCTLMDSWVSSVVSGTKSRNQLRDHVNHAIREGKIFVIIGQCEALRLALTKRGWVEKPCPEITWRMISSKPMEEGVNAQKYSSAAWVHQTLDEQRAQLVWNNSGRMINWRDITEEQLVNQCPGAKQALCSKVGILDCLAIFHWYQDPGAVPTSSKSVNFPRCYRIEDPSEKAVFIQDFGLTACLSLLKWFLATHDQEGTTGLLVSSGSSSNSISWSYIDLALAQTQEYIETRKHQDLDQAVTPHSNSNNILRWDFFLLNYSKLTSGKVKLASDIVPAELAEKVRAAKSVIQEVSNYWPQLSMDGTQNLWICKPGFNACGNGILILNRLDCILNTVQSLLATKGNGTSWVVQKYIERPLLVHNTKFDIRQWFLVASWQPLQLWFYRSCYMRFSSKPFTLTDLHESIHLCNTAVQRRYSSAPVMDARLPQDHIWHKDRFLEHLKETCGSADVWNRAIYPQMKQAILSVVLPSQDLLDNGTAKIRRNSFELLGADFLIDENYVPWLLEVNSTPLLYAPSPVFQELARQCLDDCMKVIIDRRQDPNAETGLFELIYEEQKNSPSHLHITNNNAGQDFTLVGEPYKGAFSNSAKIKPAVGIRERFKEARDELKARLMGTNNNRSKSPLIYSERRNSSKTFQALLSPSFLIHKVQGIKPQMEKLGHTIKSLFQSREGNPNRSKAIQSQKVLIKKRRKGRERVLLTGLSTPDAATTGGNTTPLLTDVQLGTSNSLALTSNSYSGTSLENNYHGSPTPISTPKSHTPPATATNAAPWKSKSFSILFSKSKIGQKNPAIEDSAPNPPSSSRPVNRLVIPPFK